MTSAQVIGDATIRQLSPQVANAIAAGEVVDRPAAILRELIDNSRDAAAQQIQVQIGGSGLDLIAVSDDGCGISVADLPLAVSRHATSKIQSVSDLESISTLGFRGEALASIAAVSELCIESRCAGEPAGGLIAVHGGALQTQRPTTRNVGTTVEVANLFFNTPARKRFMRTAKTETAVCQRLVTDSILAAPSIAFECHIDERLWLRSSGNGLGSAVSAVFRNDAAELIDIDETYEDVRVHGVLSQPLAHKPTRHNLVVTLNGRRIYNPALHRAIDEGYRGLLPTGRYPFGILALVMEPTEFDVNVHPAKREARFRNESAVFRAISRTCWAATKGSRVSVSIASVEKKYQLPPTSQIGFAFQDSSSATQRSDTTDPTIAQVDAPGLAALAPLSSLGQIGDQWLVAKSANHPDLVLVDPHAAHEKVLYVAIKKELEQGTAVQGQILLLPCVFECQAAEIAAFERHGEILERAGFTIDIFGENFLRCTAVPATTADADPEKLIHEILQVLADDVLEYSKLQHALAASMACHAAVRFGDSLSVEAQARLLQQLVETPGGLTCPHGRPTVVILPDTELRRLFRRPA